MGFEGITNNMINYTESRNEEKWKTSMVLWMIYYMIANGDYASLNVVKLGSATQLQLRLAQRKYFYIVRC